MRKFIIVLLLAPLCACTSPPLAPYRLESVKVGQTRDQVLAQIQQSPDKVVHTTFKDDDYIAYYYHIQAGIKTSTVCGLSGNCTSVNDPVSVPYLFIFRGTSQPKLAYFGSLERMKKSIDSDQRLLIKQLTLINVQPTTGK